MIYIVPAMLVLIAVILIRAIMFKPYKREAILEERSFDRDKAISDLSEMIKCKTVSYHDKSKEDNNEFINFKTLVARLFPKIHNTCDNIEIDERALLFRLKGKSDLSPIVLMAHYDVVPADEKKWTHGAFSGEIFDNCLWGRGTLDTKATVNAILQAVEHLLQIGFCPENDIYLAFGGDEEINGHGAFTIVDYFEKNGIKPKFILDEGGAIVKSVFPGVDRPSALIGIAEKGIIDIELKVCASGGHASTPPKDTPIDLLVQACNKIRKKGFKFYISTAASQMFDSLARESNFFYRIIFANLWLFSPVFNMMTKKSGGESNALVRTTCAFTRMKGSESSNVLPTEASINANIRINPGETVDSVLEYLKKTINDPRVEINVIYGNDPSINSDIDSEGFGLIKRVINSTWDNIIVSPYLMLACSDARHWCRISDKVFRFSPMMLEKYERDLIHGNDERIPVITIEKTVEFYIKLIEKC